MLKRIKINEFLFQETPSKFNPIISRVKPILVIKSDKLTLLGIETIEEWFIRREEGKNRQSGPIIILIKRI